MCTWLKRAPCVGGCELGCRLYQMHLQGERIPVEVQIAVLGEIARRAQEEIKRREAKKR